MGLGMSRMAWECRAWLGEVALGLGALRLARECGDEVMLTVVVLELVGLCALELVGRRALDLAASQPRMRRLMSSNSPRDAFGGGSL